MKKIYIIPILVFAFIVIGVSSVHATPAWNIQVGETFAYKIKWMGIPVGHMRATVKEESVFEGADVYVIEFAGGTNRWCSLIYRIRDRFVSYIDKETLLPLKLEVTRREGFYKKDAVTLFDHAQGKAYFHNTLDGSHKEYAIPPTTVDIVSVFYELRHREMSPQKIQRFDVAFAERVFYVYGRAEKGKKIKLPNGKRVDAYYTKPWARARKGTVHDGTISAYFTADKYHLPLKITIKAPLFTRITAALDEGEPLFT